MTKWITIAKHEFAYSIRRKEFLFVTFGLPLIMFALIGLPVFLAASTTGPEEFTIGYMDNTGLFESANFTLYSTEELAKNDLLEGKTTHFFVIPSDYRSTGKIFGLGAVGLTQVLIWQVMGIAVLSSGPVALLLAGINISIPLTSPITMIMRISTGNVKYYEVVLSLIILTISILVIIELSVKIFRASLLMYGKKPTISELMKYVH
jgi:ABC-type Na+ efflux pump permease subunit